MFLVALLLYIISLVVYIIVIIDAFRDEIWKGVLTLLCGFYWLWYALLEWDHDHKWLLLLLSVLAFLGGVWLSPPA